MYELSSIEVTIMKRTLIMVSIVSAIAASVAGCTKKQPLLTTAASARTNVSIHRVGLSSFTDTYEATGTVNARTTTQIASNLLGRITSLRVNEGDPVKKGQVLVELDDREPILVAVFDQDLHLRFGHGCHGIT